MTTQGMASRTIETDVLVIGGGMAGCFVAIKAAEGGTRVVVWEKAVVQRSGGAGGDPMHFHSVPPLPSAGATKEESIDTIGRYIGIGLAGKGRLDGLSDKNLDPVLYRDYWDRIHDLESWGVNLRWDDGEYNLLPDPMTGLPTEMRIRPKGLKKKLFEQLLKSGAELLERTMGIDLLTQDGAVVGATGLNVRNGQFIVCKAKAVVIATSGPTRIHHPHHGPAVGRYKMIYAGPPPDAGDGPAMSFRAGAELVNMELPTRDRALMYEHDFFFGKIGGLNQAQPRVPVVNNRGEKIGETHLRLPEQLREEEAGRTPCYLDATGVPEAVDYIEESRLDEFPMTSRMCKVHGLSWRKDKLEMTEYFPYGFNAFGGTLADTDAKTSLKGLFAAGMGASNARALGGAVVLGAIAGENAVAYATEIGEPKVDGSQVQAQKEPVFAPMKKGYGVPPLELEMKLRDIMFKYCGVSRNEGKLNQGLWRLRSVRDKFLPEMVARTPHELMTCQEVRNLYLIGELHLISARERKESGIGFYRKDYPDRYDAPFETAIVLRRLESGEIKISRRKMPELKEEFKG